MKYLRFCIVFLMIMLSLTEVMGKDLRVFGYVYMPNREPASFVMVQVKGTTVGTLSREDGYYEIEFSAEDTATVQFSILGCKPYEYSVNAKKRKVFQKMIYLEEDAVLLEEAEVKEFSQQTSTMEKINVEQLKKIPSSTGGIETILSTYAGVSSNNEMSTQYSVRGGNYDENCIYVNDIEIYRPQLVRAGEQEGLSFVNLDMVEGVAFSAGGFSASYGDKSASVLDVTYKKPKHLEGSVSGSFLGASAYVGHTTKNQKFSQLHGFRFKSSNYLFSSLDKTGDFDQKFIDYQTLLTYKFTGKWSLDFLGNYARNTYNSIPESCTKTFGLMNNPTTFNVYFDGQEKDLFQTFFGAFTLRYSPLKNMNWKLIAAAFSSQERVGYDISGEYWLKESGSEDVQGVGAYIDYARNNFDANLLDVSLRGDYKIKNNSLYWGLGWKQEFFKDYISEFQVRDSADYLLPLSAEGISSQYNLRSENELTSWRMNAFVRDEARIKSTIGAFIVQGGVRLSYWSFNKEFLASPRVSVAFLPKKAPNLNFRLATGLYYQSPFYKEIRDTITDLQNNTIVELNKNIKSPRSIHALVGTDYYFKGFGRPFKFTAEVYYKHYDRLISYTIDNLKLVYSGQNDAQGYTAGIDLKLFGEFVPGVDSWVSLSLMRSREKVDGSSEYTSRPNEQRYNFSLFFQDYFPGFPKFKFHLKFIWADGLPLWAPNVKYHSSKNTSRSRAYRRVDIGVSRAFKKGDYAWLDRTKVFKALKSINLAFEVFNLLNFDNVASYFWLTDSYSIQHAIPNSLTGRQFNLRLSLDF